MSSECCSKEGSCECMCHKMLSVLVFLFGLVFLLDAMAVISHAMAYMIWPVIVMVAGATMFFKGSCKCCKPV